MKNHTRNHEEMKNQARNHGEVSHFSHPTSQICLFSAFLSTFSSSWFRGFFFGLGGCWFLSILLIFWRICSGVGLKSVVSVAHAYSYTGRGLFWGNGSTEDLWNPISAQTKETARANSRTKVSNLVQDSHVLAICKAGFPPGSWNGWKSSNFLGLPGSYTLFGISLSCDIDSKISGWNLSCRNLRMGSRSRHRWVLV